MSYRVSPRRLPQTFEELQADVVKRLGERARLENIERYGYVSERPRLPEPADPSESWRIEMVMAYLWRDERQRPPRPLVRSVRRVPRRREHRPGRRGSARASPSDRPRPRLASGSGAGAR